MSPFLIALTLALLSVPLNLLGYVAFLKWMRGDFKIEQ